MRSTHSSNAAEPPAGTHPAAVTIDSVSKAFARPVLHAVSVRIDPGRITSLVGANGAGKTTLFNIVSGFLRPDGGHVSIGDTDVTSWSATTIARAGVGRLFQDLRIFPSLSVIDNMLVGVRLPGEAPSIRSRTRTLRVRRSQAIDRARELLSVVGLERSERSDGTSLSYGQQKRLGIARALMAEPKVLMLDEPSAGIDPRNLGSLLELIETLVIPGRTVLLIEHNRAVVEQLASRVVFLHDGRVLRDGTPDDVFGDTAVAERYLGQ